MSNIPIVNKFLLNDGTSFILLNDGVSDLLLNSGGSPAPKSVKVMKILLKRVNLPK